MKGNNVMHLNSATLIEAVQEYLDKRITPNIKVESVLANSSTAYEQAGMFVIKVSEMVEKDG
jgi:hypothetical protein